MLYKSINAGGVLQAYALNMWLNKNGFKSEQINYSTGLRIADIFAETNNQKNILNNIKYLTRKVIDEALVFFFYRCIRNRRIGFENFKQTYIATSREIYHNSNIGNCSTYDAYIAGGDQIWNDITDYNRGYFLDFVNNKRLKVSYAASMVNIPYPSEKEGELRELLSAFDIIMVREDMAANYLSQILNKNVDTVVDPVFLLDKDEWNNVCADRLIKEPYIFAYILGNDEKQYEWIHALSVKNKINVVAISNPSGRPTPDKIPKYINKYDMNNPAEFISLIKYADIVVTDSFHALAFSIIYDKKYFVFKRLENEKMMVRLNTLLKLVNADNSIISINDSLDMDVKNDQVSSDKKLLNERIYLSKEKLKSILKSANIKVLN